MKIWEKLCREAEKYYRPGEISPFLWGHNVVSAIETEGGKIFTGYCIEGASGVMNLCAERAAAVNMLTNSDETVVRRIVAFRDKFPTSELPASDFLPCGACREFFMQLNIKNNNTEILIDLPTRKTITLGELLPHWWGERRYAEKEDET